MQLNQTIARHIVKRAMKIIGYSVNVMDCEGVIIASGDPSRIGQKHTAAVIALRQSKTVEVDEQLARRWHYEARPGINLPICYQQKNVGVIGISGEPDQVRYYAELVKMTAELIIEQADLLEKERWDKRYREEFILKLLRNEIAAQELQQQADFFHFDLDKIRSVMIIQLLSASYENLQRFVNYLSHSALPIDFVVGDLNQILILLQENQVDLVKQGLAQALQSSEYKLAVGCFVCGNKLHLAYQTALSTLQYGKNLFPKKRMYQFSDYKLPALISNISATWYAEELLQPIFSLIQQDPKKVLFKTLQQYFLSNCDLVLTSQKLFIHTNTLRYRLDKIQQITSLSFNKIDDKFILYLGTILPLELYK